MLLLQEGVRFKAVPAASVQTEVAPGAAAPSLRSGFEQTKHFFNDSEQTSDSPLVLCLGCLQWRKPCGLVSHLQVCASDNPKGHKKCLHFAKAQINNFDASISVHEKSYGKLPFWVIAEAPTWCRQRLWNRRGRE